VNGDTPIVTVVLTSHDRGALLRHAVASVLGQDLNGIELVVVDDCSEDSGTVEYLDMLERSRIARVVRLEPCSEEEREARERVGDAVNAGLDVARGRYVSLLCDDDRFLPGRCRTYAAYLEEHPGVDVVVGKCWWLTKDGKRHPHSFLQVYRYPPEREPGHDALVEALGPPNYICHDSVMFRATEYRWEPARRPTPVDWRFWCKLHRSGARFERINLYGEEAFVPGIWADSTLKELTEARAGRCEMAKVTMYVNGTRQIQVLQDPDDYGRTVEVRPGEAVESRLVVTRKGVVPGFKPMQSFQVPDVDDEAPADHGGLEILDEEPEIPDSLISRDEPDEKAVADLGSYHGPKAVDEMRDHQTARPVKADADGKLTYGYTEQQLWAMSFPKVRSLAKGLNASGRTKKALIAAILESYKKN
jgi:hypothetical protein